MCAHDALFAFALGLLGALTACGPGVDSVDALCRSSSSCQTPPPSECVAPGVLKGYGTPGSCNIEDGTCSYQAEELPCDFGCFDTTRCKGPGDLYWSLEEVTGDLQERGQLLAVADDGTVYGIGDSKHLWAVSPAGSLEWSVQLDEAGGDDYDRSTPALDSTGRIYLSVAVWRDGFTNGDLWVYGVSPEGVVLWHALQEPSMFTSALRSTPAISRDDAVLLQHNTAVNKFTPAGEVQWQASARLGMMPVLSSDDRIFGRSTQYVADNMISLSSAGQERWNIDLPLLAANSEDWPVVRPDGVLGVHLRNKEADAPSTLIGVDPDDGAILWRLDREQGGESFVLISNAVVSPDNETFVYLQTLESGVGKIARVEADGTLGQGFVVEALTLHTLVLLQGGVLLAVGQLEENVSPSDFLVAFDQEGQLLWKTPLPAPLYGLTVDRQGMIYGYNSFGLFAFLGDRPLSAPGWAKRGADRANSRRASASD